MSPARLQDCLRILDLSKSALARKLGRSEGNIRQWLRGDARMPEREAEWIERWTGFAEKNPPPRRDG